MTRLNYSNLPPEAQDAIKKLTGYSDEKLNGDKAKQPEPKPAKTKQPRAKTHPLSLKRMLYKLAQVLVGLAIVYGIAMLAFSC